MERLTIKRNKPSVNSQYEKKDKVWTADCIEKLGKYEEAEEQGLLLRLPCNVGDTVWDIDYSRPCAYTITGYSFGIAEDYIDEPVKEDEIVYYYTNSIGSIVGSFASSEIGKTVFLTKEKAEQALEQMGEWKHERNIL